MPTGISGSTAVTALTNTTLLSRAATTTATVTVTAVNKSIGYSGFVRMAVAAAATPVNSEWFEYGAQLPPAGVLERGGVVVPAGKFLVVYSDNIDISFSYWGFAE